MMTARARSTEITPRATATGRYDDASGMTAAARPSEVNGSRIAVTMWRARKATDSSARLRWSSTVRKRGQAADWARATASRPRQATTLKRISETMPEPRVANHRIWVLIGSGSVRDGQGVHDGHRIDRPTFRAGYASDVTLESAPASR